MKLKFFFILISLGIAISAAYYFRNSDNKKQNIIYIMVDTLRADHLGYNGYPRQTSPTLDDFAKNHLNFSYAITTAPWTPPSVASQLTGLYSSTHKMLPPRSREQAKSKSIMFNSNLLTIPEELKKYGYNTGAVSSNPWISATYGYDKEFSEFQYLHREKAEVINQAAFQMIDKFSKQDEPFFIYLHYLDPHNPYKAPKPYLKMFTNQDTTRNYSPKILKRVNRYDGEIRYFDDQMSELFTYLKKNNLYNDSIIIFTSDHGEQFEEHGNAGHGYQLFNEEVHVPLVIKTNTANDKKTIEQKVSLIDIFPTILELLDLNIPEHLPGIALTKFDLIEKRQGIMSEISRYYTQKAYIDDNNSKLIIGSSDASEIDDIDDSNIFEHVVGYFEKSVQTNENKVDISSESLSNIITALKSLYKKALDDGQNNSLEETSVSDENLDELQSLGYF